MRSGRVADAVERGDEVVVQGQLAARRQMRCRPVVTSVAGGVEQAVAEPFRFGAGEVAVEGEEAGPGEQVVGA